jgi:hypothetical protein
MKETPLEVELLKWSLFDAIHHCWSSAALRNVRASLCEDDALPWAVPIYEFSWKTQSTHFITIDDLKIDA